MRWVFPYKPLFGLPIPLVPVEIVDFGMVDALADSGATISLFSAEIAEALGLALEAGDRRTLRGVAGRIEAYGHTVPVKVVGQPIALRVFFSREYLPSVNLLGRDNFFRHFLVTFDERQQRTILETGP